MMSGRRLLAGDKESKGEELTFGEKFVYATFLTMLISLMFYAQSDTSNNIGTSRPSRRITRSST